MTRVLWRRATDGTIAEIQAQGHSGYAEEGEDIVCAGISALVCTALIGLKQVARHPHEGKATSGQMFCRLLPGGTPQSAAAAQVILETTLLGLKDMEKDYPKFVRVTEGG